MIAGNGLIKRAAVVNTWWLSGGISSANCLGAWQGIGAASQAASYVNLNNAGTYDLTQGAAYPEWSAANGWHSASPNHIADYAKYLDTGIVVPSGAPTYSIIVRFRTGLQIAGRGIFGSGDSIYATANEFGCLAYYYGNAVLLHGAGASVDPGVNYADDTDGTIALAGTKPYRNGAALSGSTSGNVTSGSRTVLLWNSRINDGSASLGLAGKLYAAAIYSSTLTSDQIAALHTAMMTL